jgi:hypothetical protein
MEKEMIPLKADFIIVIPPDHVLEAMGIKVIDYTAINATTLKPKETRPVSLRKVQEQIFVALLQGYNVSADKKDGFTFIRIVNEKELERLNSEFKIERRDK